MNLARIIPAFEGPSNELVLSFEEAALTGAAAVKFYANRKPNEAAPVFAAGGTSASAVDGSVLIAPRDAGHFASV